MTCPCGQPGCSGTAAYDPAPVPVYVQVSSPEDLERLATVRRIAVTHDLPVALLAPQVIPEQRTGSDQVRAS